MIDKKTLESLPYTNFHLHTHFSIQDGVSPPRDHIVEALAKGHRGFAITDHGVMSGCIQTYKLARDPEFLKELGRTSPVPVVLGSEMYISRDLAERNPKKKYNHVTVLAKNEIGYRNLCYLTSIASLEDHFYSRPRISLAELFAHKEGLIVTSGCFIGMIPMAITEGTGEEESLIELFKSEFGSDFYIEFHITDIRKKWSNELKTHVDQGFNPQEKVNLRLLELAAKYDVKVIIAQDAHMPKKEHYAIQSIMIWGSPSGKSGWHFSEAYFTMSVPELYEKCLKITPYLTDEMFVACCMNSEEVLQKCKNYTLDFQPQLPEIKYEEHPVNADETLEDKLVYLEEAFADIDPEFSKLLNVSRSDIAMRTSLKVIVQNNKIDLTDDKYRIRLIEEINTIQRNGIVKLIDYFMLLEDVTRFVRNNAHARGYGRGSGAGSLFAYSLDITDADPVKYNLLFSRFLTKERVGKYTFDFPELPRTEKR
jgi:DNA polymerase-3 subunit alpha